MRIVILACLINLSVSFGFAAAFSASGGNTPSSPPPQSQAIDSTGPSSPFLSRSDVIGKLVFGTTATAASLWTVVGSPGVAGARGRATLEQSYDRYAPRISAGGSFYASELKSMVNKGDFASIKAATAEPPKKTKADRAKADGGIAERAAQAGSFSDARVLSAAGLFAASFSDNSISQKTKRMQAQVDILKEVVLKMNEAARLGLGEEIGGGGLFGLGAKKSSKAELAQQIKALYVEGGNAWNQYIFAANDQLPLSLKKFDYIQ